VRNGAKDPRLPNTANIAFDFVEAEAILMMLDQLGICASSGSACTTGSVDPSHVLTLMGVSPLRARGSVRFSLGFTTPRRKVDYLLRHLARSSRSCAPFLRSIRSTWTTTSSTSKPHDASTTRKWLTRCRPADDDAITA